MPMCIKCLMDKPDDGFPIRADNGKRRGECGDCSNKRKTAWAAAHPERRSEATHKYYAKSVGKDPEDCRGIRLSKEDQIKRRREEKRRHYRKYRLALIAKQKIRHEKRKAALSVYGKEWRANNAAKKAEHDRLWRLAHPELVALYSNTRRARKLRSQPPWLTSVHLAQLREFYEIAQARYMQTGCRHHVDHIFPLHGKTFSGLHVPWNLQVLTKQRNLQKQQSVPPEYAHMLDYGR